MEIVPDAGVPFPAVFVRPDGRKAEQRRIVADYAVSWITYAKESCMEGCIIFDIDDTLIDDKEKVSGGFEFMVDMYNKVAHKFPIHIVTARPDEDHASCMQMLADKGINVPIDRLHMLRTELWGKDLRHVEEFKWKCYTKCHSAHRGVIARFGDKMWDVAHIRSLRSYLCHVKDENSYIFFDPYMQGTLSCKLPGAGD